jgi:SAM-dependent methyltransferase
LLPHHDRCGSLATRIMHTNRQRRERFIPALSYHFLTPLYDPLMRMFLRETRFKSHLIALAEIESGQQVLGLGCGTGTLLLLLKRHYPKTTMTGLDADPEALILARKKLARSHVQATLDEGTATVLPYADGSFDRVLSSLLFHHLNEEQTVQAAREASRVLKPEGYLVVADWGKAKNLWMRFAFTGVQLLDGFATTTKNVEGALPALFAQAGFVQIQQMASYATLFGTLALYKTRKA